MTPAATIASKASLIVAAFEQGVTIKSPNGLWLAIPNPDVYPTRMRKRRGVSPIGIAEARFGRLRFVFIKGRKLGLLVTDVRKSRTARGGFRKLTDAARRRGDQETKVIFFLVPQARLPRLLKGEVIRRRFASSFPADYQRRFDFHLDQAARQPGRLTYHGDGGE